MSRPSTLISAPLTRAERAGAGMARVQRAAAAVEQYLQPSHSGVSSATGALEAVMLAGYAVDTERAMLLTEAEYEMTSARLRLPAWPVTVRAVSQWLMTRWRRAQGLARNRRYFGQALGRLRSIATLRGRWHLTAADEFHLKRVLVTLGLSTPVRDVRRARALLLSDLRAIRLALERSGSTMAQRAVFTACQLAVHCAMRAGTVTELSLADIAVEAPTPRGEPTAVVLYLTLEKTQSGRRLRVEASRTDPDVCGVRAVAAWLSDAEVNRQRVAADGRVDADAPVFPRTVGSALDWARPMTRRELSAGLKALAQLAGLPEALRFSGHSARRGGITERTRRGEPEHEVMQLAGHADVRTHRLYVEGSQPAASRTAPVGAAVAPTHKSPMGTRAPWAPASAPRAGEGSNLREQAAGGGTLLDVSDHGSGGASSSDESAAAGRERGEYVTDASSEPDTEDSSAAVPDALQRHVFDGPAGSPLPARPTGTVLIGGRPVRSAAALAMSQITAGRRLARTERDAVLSSLQRVALQPPLHG